jgi:hypothetical protein
MMLRLFYRCVLRLHPLHFRRRFSEEMLWIFDQQSGSIGRVAVLVDGFASLARQWLLRPSQWEEAGLTTTVVRSPDGVPLFHTFERAAPRSAALLNGMILSIGVFSSLALVIAHGGPSGVVKLPRVVVVPENITPEEALALEQIQPRGAGAHREQPSRVAPVLQPSSILEPAGSTGRSSGEPVTAVGSPRPIASRHLEIDVVEPASSSSSDSMILPRDRGDLAILQAGALLSLLDKNGDGVISENESAQTTQRLQGFLNRADRNQDEVITEQELRDAISAARNLESPHPSNPDMN